MPYPTWQAGQRITADLLLGGSTFNAEQGSDQTVTNSTTLADSNLVVPAEANARYEYTLQAIYSTNTTGKIKFQWSVPNGSMMVRSGHGLGNGQTGGATVGTLVWSSRGDFSTVFNVGGTTGSPPETPRSSRSAKSSPAAPPETSPCSSRKPPPTPRTPPSFAPCRACAGAASANRPHPARPEPTGRGLFHAQEGQ